MQVTARHKIIAAASAAFALAFIVSQAAMREAAPSPPPPIIDRAPSADRGAPPDSMGRRIVIGADAHHQFYERVHFTGPKGKADLICLIDTGAAALLLNREQARQLGFDPDRLDYSSVVTTVNGRSRTALITLKSVSIAGQFTKRDMRHRLLQEI